MSDLPGGSTAAADGADWLVSVRPGRGSVLQLLVRGNPPPAMAKDELRTVAFDGALYNPAAVHALAADRRTTLTDDASLILAAYARAGEKVLETIQGIFALLIFDAGSNTLLAVRDSMGVYPLFYAGDSEELYFSTSADTLAQLASVSGEINRAVLAGHIVELWPTPDETAFTGVSRLLSGHAVRFRDGARHVYRYWDPRVSAQSPMAREQEGLEHFEVLLRQAVDRCLGFGAAAVALSGGIDSSTVAVAVVEASHARAMQVPWALSFVSSHPAADEREIQAQVASELGMPALTIPFEEAVGPGQILLSALRRSSAAPMPLLNMLGGAHDRLPLEAKARNCRVLLTGDGGDEWLVPLPSYAADRLLALDIRSLNRLSRAYQWYSPASRFDLYRAMLWRSGLRPLLRASGTGLASRWVPGRSSAYRRRLLESTLPSWLAPDQDTRRDLLDRLASQPPAVDPRKLYAREKHAMLELPQGQLNMEDAFATFRRCGVRIFAPLLDADLVAFLYNLPPTLLHGGDRVKWVARGFLAAKLPALEHAWDRKRYADPYLGPVLRQEGLEAWCATGGVPRLAQLGIADAKSLNAEIERVFSRGEGTDSYRIFAAMSTEAWLQPRIFASTRALRGATEPGPPGTA